MLSMSNYLIYPSISIYNIFYFFTYSIISLIKYLKLPYIDYKFVFITFVFSLYYLKLKMKLGTSLFSCDNISFRKFYICLLTPNNSVFFK